MRTTLGVLVLLAMVLAAGWMHAQPEAPKLKGLPGELVYTQGSTTWRLQATDCDNEILQKLLNDDDHLGNTGQDGNRAKAGRVQRNGTEWGACWISGYGSEYIVADFRGVGYLPQEWFARR